MQVGMAKYGVDYKNADVVLFEPNSDDAEMFFTCLLYTSDAADERSSVDLGGRRIIKKKKIERCIAGDQIENSEL